MDKTIEVVKAAMEKENKMKDSRKESMDEKIDDKGHKNSLNNDLEAADKAEAMINFDENAVSKDCDMKENEGSKSEAPEEKQSKQSKSFFKGVKNKEIAAKDIKIEELNDRLIRNIAEFDNFRKRSDKEKSQMFDMGVKSIIEKLLPVIDNFERGLGSFNNQEKESSYVQGFEMIYKQIINILNELGVKPIEAVGNEFDPTYHNAVMHDEDENMGENIIAEEFQKGYMYRDIVVRHSMVKVVN